MMPRRSNVSLPLLAVLLAASVVAAAARLFATARPSFLPAHSAWHDKDGLVLLLTTLVASGVVGAVHAVLSGRGGRVLAGSGADGVSSAGFPHTRKEQFSAKVQPPDTRHARVEVVDMLDGVRTTSNALAPAAFDSEVASGSYYFMHRPVDVDAKDNAASASYFRGKRRHWEVRFQLTFKKAVKASELRLGTSPFERVNVGAKQVALHRLVIKMMGPALGGFHNSPGDDPKDCLEGELEQPETSIPICEADQEIPTSPGQEPPSLLAEDFAQMGRLKVTDAKAFKRELNERIFEKGETHTFAFWGPSRAGNLINWQLDTIPMMKGVSLDMLNGPPPIVLSIYVLRPSTVEQDHRHLESRKDLLLRVAGWSSLYPPTAEVLRKLCVHELDEVAAQRDDTSKPKAIRSWSTPALATDMECCWLGIGKMLRTKMSKASAATKAALSSRREAS